MVLAWIAGFVAVLIFHQPVLALLSSAGVTQAIPYAAQSVEPIGVPQFISAAFWGGVWGVVLYAISRHWNASSAYWLKCLLFGMIFPTLVAWMIVAPMKGLPTAAGGNINGMLTGLCVNAAWGIGTGLLIRLMRLHTSR